VWGRKVSLTTKFHTHLVHLVKKKKMMIALPCYKKRRKVSAIKKEKKGAEKKEKYMRYI